MSEPSLTIWEWKREHFVMALYIVLHNNFLVVPAEHFIVSVQHALLPLDQPVALQHATKPIYIPHLNNSTGWLGVKHQVTYLLKNTPPGYQYCMCTVRLINTTRYCYWWFSLVLACSTRWIEYHSYWTVAIIWNVKFNINSVLIAVFQAFSGIRWIK